MDARRTADRGCAAGIMDKSAHGIRKAGATRDAEDGWTEAELDAKYGWRGGRMAAKYTGKMNREKLALGASDRVKARTSIPAPAHKVRERLEVWLTTQ